jgi:hypothetical protein
MSHADGTYDFIWVRGDRAARKHAAHGDFVGVTEEECENLTLG